MSLELPTDRGGIIVDPHMWMDCPGYEFWIIFGDVTPFSTAGTTIDALTAWGWTNGIATTNSNITEGSSGDFLSSADHDPTRLVMGSTNLNLASPCIFGDYSHALQASRFLGYLPTKLVVEVYARFSVNSANETNVFFGLGSTGQTNSTASPCSAAIVSDGANFRLRAESGDDAGAAVDTAWHLFKIQIDDANTEWFIDDVSQGSFATNTDNWPAAFVIINGTGTTNRVELAWARLYYK